MRHTSLIIRAVRAALPVILVGAGACSVDNLTVPNPNAPNLGGTQNSRAAVNLAVQGILHQSRANLLGFVVASASYGREYWLMQPQFGGTISGPYRDWKVYGLNGAGQWTGFFRNLRDVAVAKQVIDTASGSLSATEKSAARGVIYTFQALEQLFLLLARDTVGTVTAVSGDPTDIKPFVSRDSGYKFVTNILDSGLVALQSGGAAFPFTLAPGLSGSPGSGFAPGAVGFDASTPTGFIKFNRALKARVEVYRGSLGCNACYTAALTALQASFFTGVAGFTKANRGLGVYHVYSPATNDVANGLIPAGGQFNYVNTSLKTVPGVTSDLRWGERVRTAALVGAVEGFTSDIEPTVYAAFTAPVPIVRNEELVLKYAEAAYFSGNTTEALAAINAVRTLSGGLAPRGAFTSPADFRTELLAQGRLSLLFEGHRWVDNRRLLGNAALPGLQQQYPTGVTEPAAYSVATSLPVPQTECDARARSGNPALKGPGCP
jgi:hypothetical protein